MLLSHKRSVDRQPRVVNGRRCERRTAAAVTTSAASALHDPMQLSFDVAVRRCLATVSLPQTVTN